MHRSSFMALASAAVGGHIDFRKEFLTMRGTVLSWLAYHHHQTIQNSKSNSSDIEDIAEMQHHR